MNLPEPISWERQRERHIADHQLYTKGPAMKRTLYILAAIAFIVAMFLLPTLSRAQDYCPGGQCFQQQSSSTYYPGGWQQVGTWSGPLGVIRGPIVDYSPPQTVTRTMTAVAPSSGFTPRGSAAYPSPSGFRYWSDGTPYPVYGQYGNNLTPTAWDWERVGVQVSQPAIVTQQTTVTRSRTRAYANSTRCQCGCVNCTCVNCRCR